MKHILPSTLLRRLLLWFTLAAMPVCSHAIEEPDYEVLRKRDNVELRQYAPHVVAEVVLDAGADDAGNLAFPILAGYIFGKNKGERKFAMTAPVTQRPFAVVRNSAGAMPRPGPARRASAPCRLQPRADAVRGAPWGWRDHHGWRACLCSLRDCLQLPFAATRPARTSGRRALQGSPGSDSPNTRSPASRQAQPGGGDFWGAEERRACGQREARS